ncbi:MULTISPECIES: acyl-CoA dehydrogenase family protein [Paenarthrobacter]|uniref:acyl-CoA dehydrogenase family protein n=1 Tax=Paenarthrobacter TaxID=1742992 RepID=UPI000784071C|nr:acyl-CoA dehydrogenase family protein [Paenarthrobacter ureafaciens]RWW95426.1 oxidoreductase [Paenarthrobacter ureafaciens]
MTTQVQSAEVVRSLPQVLASREAALEAARALKISIAERTALTEELRSVPEQSIAEIMDSGLFGMVTPRRWGGSELGFGTMLEVQAELASACTSTGWVYGVLAGHTWLAALFPEQAQEEVFEDPRSLIASLIRLGGNAPQRVDGGFRWQGGTGRFCSGIDHSNWVLVGGQVTEDDGSAEPWYFLIPATDIEIIDDWHAVGLKGTGSKSLVVKDAFIPAHRAVRFSDLGAGRAPGAALHQAGHYTLPYDTVWPLSLAGAPIGAAMGALNAFVEATTNRVAALPPVAQAGNATAFARIAEAGAKIDAARALLLRDAATADDALPGTTFTRLEKATRSRNLAFAIQQCRDAANTLYQASGGSGVYLSGEMQRWWRDVNAASQHVAFTWDLAAVAYGRAVAGLEALGGPGAAKPGPGAAAAGK